jgi:hypothetical protein
LDEVWILHLWFRLTSGYSKNSSISGGLGTRTNLFSDLVKVFARFLVPIWSRLLPNLWFQFDSFLIQISEKDKNILWGHIGRVLARFLHDS